jgi:hypothetical protein
VALGRLQTKPQDLQPVRMLLRAPLAQGAKASATRNDAATTTPRLRALKAASCHSHPRRIWQVPTRCSPSPISLNAVHKSSIAWHVLPRLLKPVQSTARILLVGCCATL